MQAGNLVGGDVLAFTTRVLVNGVQRPVESWDVGRELSGDLPEQVSAMSGVTQATGSITWATQPDMSTTAANPWNKSSGWLPDKGDRVVIYAGDGTTEWVQFTGRIDETTGSIGGLAQSSVIDDIDKLNARFSHEAMLRIMPPLARGGERRAAGLTHMYYVDAALRRAGFYATPPPEVRTILSVPAQSSMWPEEGFMTEGVIGGADGGPWCASYDGPDGISVADVLNIYAPALRFPLSERVRFSMTVGLDHTGGTSMKAFYGATDYVELAITGSRNAVARVNGVEVCRLGLGSAVRVSLYINSGVWILRTNNNATSTGNTPDPTAELLDRITITADGNSRVAGFHAAHPNSVTVRNYTDFVPSARYGFADLAHLGLMDAGRAIEPTTCKDVLEQISKSVLSATWIDERGVFQWVPSLVLSQQGTMQTVSTADDIRSLSWQDSLLGARSGVVGEYDLPAVSLSTWDNVLWHQGAAETLESGQVRSEFLAPGSEEDWIGPSPDYSILGTPGAGAPANSGWGHITGAVITDGVTENIGAEYLTSTLERINVNTWKSTHAAKTLPSGNKLELRYPSESQQIWARWWKQAFPLIRGFAKVEWAKQETSSTVPQGSEYAPVLTHTFGHWVSRDDNDLTFITRILDFLANQVARPLPVITGLDVQFDPRRQLGDVITIGSPNLMGVYLRALVVGVTSGADGSYTQSLSVRILRAGTSYITYEEYGRSLGSEALTYQQWQALGPLPQTFDEFNTVA